MSSLNEGIDESSNVSEATRSKVITHNYGVAGTNPLTDYSSRINVLLCDAMANRWDSDVSDGGTIYPTRADMFFLNTWMMGQKDIEVIFREGFDDTPVQLRTTDWRFQGHLTTVDVHIFVRGKGGDVEPDTLGAVIRGLEKIIALNRTSLILNSWCEVVSTQPGPLEKIDSNQSLWHWLMKVRVGYYKVRTL